MKGLDPAGEEWEQLAVLTTPLPWPEGLLHDGCCTSAGDQEASDSCRQLQRLPSHTRLGRANRISRAGFNGRRARLPSPAPPSATS